jgi:hypothetical protein
MRRRLFRVTILVGAALIILTLLLYFLSRGASTTERWIAAQRARGEKFTIEELGLARPEQVSAFMEQLEFATASLKTLSRATVRQDYRGANDVLKGRKPVGWAGTNLYAVQGEVMDWVLLEREVASLSQTITTIHELLHSPPLDPGWDYRRFNIQLNRVAIRTLAQALHSLVLCELHRGDRDAAHRHAIALIGMAQLHSKAYTLVDQMIRNAVSDLVTDAVWELLQTDAWSDIQLAALQHGLESLSFMDAVARSFEVERAMALALFPSWGNAPGPWTPPSVQQLPPSDRLHAFFWRRLWAEKDLLAYLQYSQVMINTFRLLHNGLLFIEVRPDLDLAFQTLTSQMEGVRQMRYWFSSSVILNANRAAETLIRSETSRRLAITAIALERHRSLTGTWPQHLSELVPRFLNQPPIDPYSGNSLLYRFTPNLRYTLYAVGPDGLDKNGVSPHDLVWAAPEWSTDAQQSQVH